MILDIILRCLSMAAAIPAWLRDRDGANVICKLTLESMVETPSALTSHLPRKDHEQRRCELHLAVAMVAVMAGLHSCAGVRQRRTEVVWALTSPANSERSAQSEPPPQTASGSAGHDQLSPPSIQQDAASSAASLPVAAPDLLPLMGSRHYLGAIADDICDLPTPNVGAVSHDACDLPTPNVGAVAHDACVGWQALPSTANTNAHGSRSSPSAYFESHEAGNDIYQPRGKCCWRDAQK
eukprot:symbB.v1.2.021646.t1/scaffold1746.1/size103363/4